MAPRKKAVLADAVVPAPDLPVEKQAPKPANRKRGAAKLDVGNGAVALAEAIPPLLDAAPAGAAQATVPAGRVAPVPKRQRVASTSVTPSRQGLDLFVFGSNPFGALGLGEDETVKYRPAAVEVQGEKFSQVACGGMHTVALSVTGEVWTWGVNDEGALGRITQGTCWEGTPDDQKADASLPGKAAISADDPKAVDFRITQIAAGDGFTFAVGSNGAVYGCGCFKDDVGGTSGFSFVPAGKNTLSKNIHTQRTFIKVFHPDSNRDMVRSLKCGARHAVILTARGEVLTWGIGSQGQLGRVDAFESAETSLESDVAFVATSVTSLASLLGSSPVVAIGCGSYSTFAISKAGEVAAWGLNNSAQLGLEKASNDANLHWAPELIPSLQNIVSIEGGEQHTLAVTKKGRLLSFGAPTYGMLGRSGVDVQCANILHPVPVEVEGLDGLKADCVTAATNVSAAVMNDGSLWLWGANVTFQLAKGDDDADETLPMKFKRTKTFGFRKVKQVSFGGQHAALLASAPEAASAPAAVAAAAPAAAAAPLAAAAAAPVVAIVPPVEAAATVAAPAAEVAAVDAAAAAAPTEAAPAEPQAPEAEEAAADPMQQ